MGKRTVFGDRVEGSTWLVKQQQANGGVWSNGAHKSARATYIQNSIHHSAKRQLNGLTRQFSAVVHR